MRFGKMFRNILCAALASVMCLGVFAACGGGTKDRVFTQYTSTNPMTWSPLAYQNDGENLIVSQITDSLLTFSLANNDRGYSVTPSMAKALPTDVSYDHRGTNGVPTTAKKGDGYAWRFEVREDAQWEDGTKINADAFIYSMRQLLDSRLDNKQAERFTGGRGEINGAYGYMHSNNTSLSRAILDDMSDYTTEFRAAGSQLYLGWNTPLPRILIAYFYEKFDINVQTWSDFYAEMPEAFMIKDNDSGETYDVFEKWQSYIDNELDDAVDGLMPILSLPIFYADESFSEKLARRSQFAFATVDLLSKWMLTPEAGDTSGYYYGFEADLDTYGDQYGPWATNLITDAFIFAGTDETPSLTVSAPWIYELFLGVKINVAPVQWSSVGFKRISASTFDVVFVNPMDNMYDLAHYFGAVPFLVHEQRFEASKSTPSAEGANITSSYNTTFANTISYGPYKLKEVNAGQSIKLTKNNKWAGYSDVVYKGQFQTTDIVIELGVSQSAALEKFANGKLSTVSLTDKDLPTYMNNAGIHHTPNSSTYKLLLNSNRGSLEALQEEASENVNKLMLSYTKFRQAISLSLDRTEFAASIAATSKASLGLLSDTYISKANNMTKYRSETLAKLSVLAAYDSDIAAGFENIESPWNPSNFMDKTDTQVEGETYTYSERLETLYAALNGKNIEKARALFVEAFEEATTAEDYLATQTVVIDYVADHPTPSNEFKAQANLLQKYIDAALAGTDYAGKVEINVKGSQSQTVLVQNLRAGLVDATVLANGTDRFSPFTVIDDLYVVGGQRLENGLDLNTQVTIKIDDVAITLSLSQWGRALTGDVVTYNDEGAVMHNFSKAAYETKLLITSTVEYYILSQCAGIPIANSFSSSLLSSKLSYGTNTYLDYIGFGGVRYIKYN